MKKGSVNKKKKFIDIIPTTRKSPKPCCVIPWEVIAMIVELAQKHSSVTTAANEKTIYRDLMQYVGKGVVCPEAVKLAAVLGLLCQKLADGNKKKSIQTYLESRIVGASYWVEFDRDFLAGMTDAVRQDLDELS